MASRRSSIIAELYVVRVMRSIKEKQEIRLKHFEGIVLLVLFLFCRLTKMYGRILHPFLSGEDRKAFQLFSSRKHLKINV